MNLRDLLVMGCDFVSDPNVAFVLWCGVAFVLAMFWLNEGEV